MKRSPWVISLILSPDLIKLSWWEKHHQRRELSACIVWFYRGALQWRQKRCWCWLQNPWSSWRDTAESCSRCVSPQTSSESETGAACASFPSVVCAAYSSVHSWLCKHMSISACSATRCEYKRSKTSIFEHHLNFTLKPIRTVCTLTFSLDILFILLCPDQLFEVEDYRKSSPKWKKKFLFFCAAWNASRPCLSVFSSS